MSSVANVFALEYEPRVASEKIHVFIIRWLRGTLGLVTADKCKVVGMLARFCSPSPPFLHTSMENGCLRYQTDGTRE
jgi:hypothetical protein